MHRQVLHKLVIKDLPADRCGGKQRVRFYLAARQASWRSSGWWLLRTYLYHFWKLIYEPLFRPANWMDKLPCLPPFLHSTDTQINYFLRAVYGS